MSRVWIFLEFIVVAISVCVVWWWWWEGSNDANYFASWQCELDLMNKQTRYKLTSNNYQMISFFNHGSWTSLIYGETKWQSLRRCNGIVRTWSSDILHGADLTYWYYFSVTLLVDGNWRDGSYCGRRLTTISCDNVPSGPAVDSKAHSTVFMVTMLVTVVGSVFILFALMALCYRSVVVHRNLSLCLRLVESLHAVPLFPPHILTLKQTIFDMNQYFLIT